MLTYIQPISTTKFANRKGKTFCFYPNTCLFLNIHLFLSLIPDPCFKDVCRTPGSWKSRVLLAKTNLCEIIDVTSCIQLVISKSAVHAVGVRCTSVKVPLMLVSVLYSPPAALLTTQSLSHYQPHS